MNNTRDNNNNLYDSGGNRIGKVQIDGSVRDGYHDRGRVTDNGRYVDEHGLDRGWVTNGSGNNYTSNSTGDGGGLIAVLLFGLLTAGAFWLFRWIAADPKRKKVATTVAIIYFAGIGLVLIYAFFFGQPVVYPANLP